MKNRALWVCSFVLFLAGSFSVHANTIYVNINAPAEGANDGTSWADAYTQLQPALTAAATGDEIWVAVGTYNPTSSNGAGYTARYYNFYMKTGVGIYGGFAGTETAREERSTDPNLTILSGDLNDDDNSNISFLESTRQDNCYHVFYHPSGYNLDSTAILDGFTVTGGNANSSPSDGGGGMYNYGTDNLTINNCIFRQNTAQCYGGGMYSTSQGKPTITNCIFENNSVGYNLSGYAGCGGGIYTISPLLTISHCTFRSNSANGTADNLGGGLLCYNKLSVTDCDFIDNSAGMGGGLYYRSFTQTDISDISTVTQCTFTGNAARSGGGLYYYDNGINLTTEQCCFSNNTATQYYGGGMYNYTSGGTVTKCTFTGNSAYGGGGVFNYYGTPTITHCTFENNITPQGNDAAYLGGAGIFNLLCSAVITDCVFNGNNVGYPDTDIEYGGGGIYNAGDCSSIILRCTFNSNTAGYGGGMFNDGSSPSITDCTFIGNSATLLGGAIGGDYVQIRCYSPLSCSYYAPEPVITNCVFEDNVVTNGLTSISASGPYGGGAICLAKEVTNCTFNNNSASCGGAISLAGAVTHCVFNENTVTDSGGGICGVDTVTDCAFNNNTASISGGAISFPSGSLGGTINNCSFTNNSVNSTASSCYGGAVSCAQYPSDATTLTISNCLFKGNSLAGPTYAYGGAVHSYANLIATNCLFDQNTVAGARVYGGGICVFSSNAVTATNCTLYANAANGTTASYGGGIFNYGSASIAANCILWDNTATTYPQLYYVESGTVSSCDVQGGYTGAGNIDVDPNFVDAGGGDFRLQSYSPCVDAGDNTAAAAITTDLLGSPRIIDGNCDGQTVVDMGAYEYYLAGDLDTTCSVDENDLALFFPYWLQANCVGPDNCGQADIDRSGTVELADFALLAQHWLQEL